MKEERLVNGRISHDMELRREKRMPHLPRIAVGRVIILPVVDDEWKVVPDRWMLPGRRHSLSTQQVRDLAASTGQKFKLITGD